MHGLASHKLYRIYHIPLYRHDLNSTHTLANAMYKIFANVCVRAFIFLLIFGFVAVKLLLFTLSLDTLVAAVTHTPSSDGYTCLYL